MGIRDCGNMKQESISHFQIRECGKGKQESISHFHIRECGNGKQESISHFHIRECGNGKQESISHFHIRECGNGKQETGTNFLLIGCQRHTATLITEASSRLEIEESIYLQGYRIRRSKIKLPMKHFAKAAAANIYLWLLTGSQIQKSISKFEITEETLQQKSNRTYKIISGPLCSL
jgi:hypothetical protein